MGSKIDTAIINNEIPRYMYKYKPLNMYGEDMLRTANIYFNKADEFNDPYELLIEDSGTYSFSDVVAYFENNIAEPMNHAEAVSLAQGILSQNANVGDFVQKELESAKLNARSRTGIFCLADSYQNTLMWAHYADSHRGFALEIDISKLDDSFFPYKVDYSTNVPQMQYLKNKKDFLKKWALTKSNHWSYERESRMILPSCPADQIVPFPKESFTKVFFGLKVNVAKRDAVIADMKANGFVCDFYQEKLNQNSYSLIFDKI